MYISNLKEEEKHLSKHGLKYLKSKLLRRILTSQLHPSVKLEEFDLLQEMDGVLCIFQAIQKQKHSSRLPGALRGGVHAQRQQRSGRHQDHRALHHREGLQGLWQGQQAYLVQPSNFPPVYVLNKFNN